MTPQEHITYLKLAFQSVGLGFTDELIEKIILTTQAVNKKKGRFSLMDAAKIQAYIHSKYPPVPEVDLFDDLDSLCQEDE